MIEVTCSNCGNKANLIFRGDNDLRIPYNWEVRISNWDTPEEFELLCNNNGCWNKEDE